MGYEIFQTSSEMKSLNDSALICLKFVYGIFTGSNNTYEQEVTIFVI